MKNSEITAENDPCFQHSHNSAFSRFPRKTDSSDASLCAGQYPYDRTRLLKSDEALLLCSLALSEAISNSKRLQEGEKDSFSDALNAACDSALKMVLDPQSVYGTKSTVLSRAELTDHAVAIHLLESLIQVNPNVTQLESKAVKDLILEVRKADVYYHESVVQLNQGKKKLEYLRALQEKKIQETSFSDYTMLKSEIRKQQSSVDESSKTMLERWELLCLFVKSKVVRIILDRLAQVRLLRAQTTCFVDQCRYDVAIIVDAHKIRSEPSGTIREHESVERSFGWIHPHGAGEAGGQHYHRVCHSHTESFGGRKLSKGRRDTANWAVTIDPVIVQVRPASRDEVNTLKPLTVCPSDCEVTRVQSSASQDLENVEIPDENGEWEVEVPGFTRSVSSSSKASTTCSSREEFWGEVVMLVREKNNKINRPGKVELGGLAERRYKKEAWLGSMNSMLCGVHTIPLSTEMFPACAKGKASKTCEQESWKLKQGCNRTRSVGPPNGPEEQSTENKDSRGEGTKVTEMVGQKRTLAEAFKLQEPCEVTKKAREDTG
eukprot:767566-Hanusia_phi.AAC.3